MRSLSTGAVMTEEENQLLMEHACEPTFRYSISAIVPVGDKNRILSLTALCIVLKKIHFSSF
jgi:hypothetical protein